MSLTTIVIDSISVGSRQYCLVRHVVLLVLKWALTLERIEGNIENMHITSSYVYHIFKYYRPPCCSLDVSKGSPLCRKLVKGRCVLFATATLNWWTSLLADAVGVGGGVRPSPLTWCIVFKLLWAIGINFVGRVENQTFFIPLCLHTIQKCVANCSTIASQLFLRYHTENGSPMSGTVPYLSCRRAGGMELKSKDEG